MTDEHGSSAIVEFASEPAPGVISVGLAIDVVIGLVGGGALVILAIELAHLLPADLWIGLVAAAVGGLLLWEAVLWWLRFRPVTRLLARRERARVATEIQMARQTARVPIAEARGGTHRVRGRVRVIVPAPGEDPAIAGTLVDGRRIGRFAVADDTGEVVIDDDMVELYGEGELPGTATVRDGDAVEVTATIREAGDALEAHGTPERKVVIVVINGG